MNWQIFGPVGYLSLALGLCVPLLWFAYWRSQHRRLCQIALALTVAAFIGAKVNSLTHVNRIRTLLGGAAQGAQRDAARKAALENRGGEVAQIAFAEDAEGEFLDKAGVDEAELKYLGGADKSATPDWKREKQSRSQDGAPTTTPEDQLTKEIGGASAATGVKVDVPKESAERTGPELSEAHTAIAHQLDRWNLRGAEMLLVAAGLILGADYLRRANNYAGALKPLRLPSAWLNSMNPVPPLVIRPNPPRRSVPAELQWLLKRGDSFVYLTDDPAAANSAITELAPNPHRQILHVAGAQNSLTNEFLFESLWFGRGSFVVDSVARVESLLGDFIMRLEQRRDTGAQVKQTAHVVWDLSVPIPPSAQDALTKLAAATGLSLFIVNASQPAA